MRWPAASVLAVLLTASCAKDAPAPARQDPIRGNVHYEVRGGGEVSSGEAEDFRVGVGPNTAELNRGDLTVNSKAYGKLNGGDQLLVEADGRVLVNGVPREPE
jgi:hypothetical protein